VDDQIMHLRCVPKERVAEMELGGGDSGPQPFGAKCTACIRA
jgi:hypothetical protein